ncbi:hypothetical protein K1719_032043 [Acacia pycnantha]|nr:hypothetical protein K1719_032043 [Acacia pycnantha]
MGRQLSYGFMVKKLKQIWERKGNIDIFDLENDFYLINFQHIDDYMEALIRGPWVIINAHLSVSRWKPDFSPKIERIESVVAWWNPAPPAHVTHNGSRFSVLQEEPRNDVGGLDAGKGKREEGSGAGSGFKKGLREERQSV